MKALSLSALAFALCACRAAAVPAPPEADASAATDAPPPPLGLDAPAPPDTFARACRVLETANDGGPCPEATPKNGQTCTDFLREHADMIDAACIADQSSRAGLARCLVRCVP